MQGNDPRWPWRARSPAASHNSRTSCRRLAAELADVRASSLGQLKAMVDEAAERGKDLMADMIARLSATSWSRATASTRFGRPSRPPQYDTAVTSPPARPILLQGAALLARRPSASPGATSAGDRRRAAAPADLASEARDRGARAQRQHHRGRPPGRVGVEHARPRPPTSPSSSRRKGRRRPTTPRSGSSTTTTTSTSAGLHGRRGEPTRRQRAEARFRRPRRRPGRRCCSTRSATS